MNPSAERYRAVAAQFTARVDAVPADAWDNPAPCDGWVARDVVAHLCEWLPAFFFGTWDIADAATPSTADDPVEAWHRLDEALQDALDDPSIVDSQRETPMGLQTFGAAIDMICTTDILVHTWDLARATGLDETLDPGEVHRYVESMEPIDAMLRSSGQYGPRIRVPDDADEQTRLIAFLGRRP
jgi:uncharacterized protein (TIGR03086 family)